MSKASSRASALDDPSSIGSVLVRLGRITGEQLNEALGEQSHFNEAVLGVVLKRLGFVSEKDLALAMKIQNEMRSGRGIHAELDVLQQKIDEVEAVSKELSKQISYARDRRRARGEVSQVIFMPYLAARA